MRSSSVTWFLRHSCQTSTDDEQQTTTTSIDVRVMRGGYKSFRRWALSRWAPFVPGAKKQEQQKKQAAEEAAEEAAAAVGGAAAESEAAAEGDDDASSPPAPYGPRVCIVGGRTGVGKTRALLAGDPWSIISHHHVYTFTRLNLSIFFHRSPRQLKNNTRFPQLSRLLSGIEAKYV